MEAQLEEVILAKCQASKFNVLHRSSFHYPRVYALLRHLAQKKKNEPP